MKRFLTLSLIFLTLFSCSEKEVFNAENIIPTPKELVVNDNKLHHINNVVISESSDNLIFPQNKDEYYLKTENGDVVIEGNAIWAKQTLAQLKDEKGRVPDVVIHDWSAYPFRGFMHDTGRNFQTIEMLKETIDLMSLYKINYFHWHLTDNPAWRIECKAYPQLNDPQYQRPGRDCGKFYTYDEIRDLIAYAKE